MVFELKPPAQTGGSWTETVLHKFGKNGGGTYPFNGLVAGKNGSLFGTTAEGGTYNEGVVLELRPPAANLTFAIGASGRG